MKLQIAFDTLSIDTVLTKTEEIKDVIGIVEIGTPMIVKDGLLPVIKIKEKFPELTVLADTKLLMAGLLRLLTVPRRDRKSVV